MPGRRTPARLAERLRDDLRPLGRRGVSGRAAERRYGRGGGRWNPGRAGRVRRGNSRRWGQRAWRRGSRKLVFPDDVQRGLDQRRRSERLHVGRADAGRRGRRMVRRDAHNGERDGGGASAVGCALAAACWREHRLWRSGRHGTARRGRRRDFCREPQPLGLGRHPSSGVRTARRDGHDGRLRHGVQLRRGGHFRSLGRQLHLHGRDVDAERGNDRSGR